jgi:hypothetical protein
VDANASRGDREMQRAPARAARTSGARGRAHLDQRRQNSEIGGGEMMAAVRVWQPGDDGNWRLGMGKRTSEAAVGVL